MPRKHVHHWKLERPSGKTSMGTCKCGEKREFFNLHTDCAVGKKNWNDDSARMVGMKNA